MLETTFVYQCFDAQGNLLYVGMTSSCERRMKQHEMYSPWYKNMSNYTAESFSERHTAARHERKLIKTLLPMHNKSGWKSVKMTLKGDTPGIQETRAEIQRRFLERIASFFNLANQSQLARVMNETAPVISRWMNGRMEISGTAIIHTHEITGWSIAEIKQELGLSSYDGSNNG